MTSISSLLLGRANAYGPYRTPLGADGGSDTAASPPVPQRSASTRPPAPAPLPGAQPAGSRFSSDTFGALLQTQQADAAPVASTPPPPDPGLGDILGGVAYGLTDRDKEMLTAATGYRFDAQGFPCDAEGHRVESCSANELILQIAGERLGGALTGDITPDYMQGLYKKFTAHGVKLNPEWLNKALDYLGKEGPSFTTRSNPKQDTMMIH